MRELTIHVPIAIPPELNPNWQYHGPGQNFLKAKSIGYLKILTKIQAQSAKNGWWWKQGGKADVWWTPLETASITITIILPPRAKKWDETNIRAALKPAEDALVQAEIIQDDSSKHIHWEDIQWERADEAGIRIEVKEIE